MKLIIAMLFVFSASYVFAQDIIVLKTGDEVSAKLLEINPDNIKYKKFDNQDGPVITVNKSDVFMIKYKNGTKDVISPMKSSDPNQTATQKKPVKDGRVAICFDAGFPTSNNDIQAYTAAIGGALRGEVNLGNNVALTATAGYQKYILKSQYAAESISLYSVPVLLGVKIYGKEPQNGFYGLIQFGATVLTAKATYSYNYNYYGYNYPPQSTTSSNTVFTFSPGFGVHLDNVDLGFNYIVMSQSGYSTDMPALRIAYVFGHR